MEFFVVRERGGGLEDETFCHPAGGGGGLRVFGVEFPVTCMTVRACNYG